MTNIQAMALLKVVVEIGANEDWRDSFAWPTAVGAVAIAAATNTGNGALGGLSAASGTPTGTLTLQILSVSAGAAFGLFDAAGDAVATGLAGVPYASGGLSFTLAQGATPFAGGDSFSIEILEGPLDIDGIAFELMVRSAATNLTVGLLGSTANGKLVNGGAALATAFPVADVRASGPGAYDFDVVATADGISKRVISGELTIDAPVTV